jgi:hypothetical protein
MFGSDNLHPRILKGSNMIYLLVFIVVLIIYGCHLKKKSPERYAQVRKSAIHCGTKLAQATRAGMKSFFGELFNG